MDHMVRISSMLLEARRDVCGGAGPVVEAAAAGAAPVLAAVLPSVLPLKREDVVFEGALLVALFVAPRLPNKLEPVVPAVVVGAAVDACAADDEAGCPSENVGAAALVVAG